MKTGGRKEQLRMRETKAGWHPRGNSSDSAFRKLKDKVYGLTEKAVQLDCGQGFHNTQSTGVCRD